MIDLCNKLVDNDLSKNDLLERIEIQKTCQGDIEAIIPPPKAVTNIISQVTKFIFSTLKISAKLFIN